MANQGESAGRANTRFENGLSAKRGRQTKRQLLEQRETARIEWARFSGLGRTVFFVLDSVWRQWQRGFQNEQTKGRSWERLPHHRTHSTLLRFRPPYFDPRLFPLPRLHHWENVGNIFTIDAWLMGEVNLLCCRRPRGRGFFRISVPSSWENATVQPTSHPTFRRIVLRPAPLATGIQRRSKPSFVCRLNLSSWLYRAHFSLSLSPPFSPLFTEGYLFLLSLFTGHSQNAQLPK